MRAFVTGGSGFVAGWLLPHLREQGDEVAAPPTDVTDLPALREAVAEAAPDAIYHLAARASVAESWDDPLGTLRVNAEGTMAVLEAARTAPIAETAGPPRVLVVASAEVYGTVTPDRLPLTEDSALLPATPYAASKVAAEFCALQSWLGRGVPSIRVRAFNHVGPGQSDRYVVSGIARQVVEAERGERPVIRVGNLAVRRDMTDVRDVVRAYRLLVEHGEPGEVYNVCSGEAVAVQELVDHMLALADLDVPVETDPALLRPVDVPVLKGDPARLQKATGWERAYSLDDTLGDVLGYWREQLGA